MRQVSLADPNSIVQREFDELLDAKRVVIVGGTLPNFNVQGQAAEQREVQIERIEVPVIVKEIELRIIEVEKVIVQREVQIERVEIPVVVTEVKEIIKEVPVIQHEIKFVEVPVVVKEVQFKEMSKLVKIAIAAQSLAITIMLLKLVLK